VTAEATVLLIVLPLFGAFLLPTIGRINASAAHWSGALLLALLPLLAIELWNLHSAGALPPLALGGYLAPLGIVLYPDRLSLTLVLALTLGSLLLWPRLHQNDATGRQATLMLLLVAGGNGLALAGDLFNAFVFYELVAVTSYALAAKLGSGDGYAAALRFLILSALGSALGLLGIALIYTLTGTLNFAHLAQHAAAFNSPLGITAFVLMVLGFGVKAELFPVNSWVPEVYGATSHRIAGLLAGIVSKLALLLLLRLITLLYSDVEVAGWLLFTLGLLGLISGELAAWRATDLRHTLAYSSIGQLGVMVMALSLPGESGMVALLALALHHLVVKPGLFLFSDGWHGTSLAGAARRGPWGGVLFLLFALSLIGVPPLPGFWAKLLFIREALAAGGPWLLAIAIILTATVLETAYLFRFLRRAYSRHGSAGYGAIGPDAALRASAFGATLVVGLLLLNPLTELLQQTAAEIIDTPSYIARVLDVPVEVTP